MGNAIEAQRNIKYLASLVKGLVAFSDEIEKAGSLEKMASDRQAKADDLQRKVERLEAVIADTEAAAKAAAATAAKKAAEVLADAERTRAAAAQLRDEARQVREDAEVARKAAIEQSAADSNVIRLNAQEAARVLLAKANEQRDQIVAERDTAKAEAIQAQKLRDEARAEVARLKSVFGSA